MYTDVAYLSFFVQMGEKPEFRECELQFYFSKRSQRLDELSTGFYFTEQHQKESQNRLQIVHVHT